MCKRTEERHVTPACAGATFGYVLTPPCTRPGCKESGETLRLRRVTLNKACMFNLVDVQITEEKLRALNLEETTAKAHSKGTVINLLLDLLQDSKKILEDNQVQDDFERPVLVDTITEVRDEQRAKQMAILMEKISEQEQRMH